MERQSSNCYCLELQIYFVSIKSTTTRTWATYVFTICVRGFAINKTKSHQYHANTHVSDSIYMGDGRVRTQVVLGLGNVVGLPWFQGGCRGFQSSAMRHGGGR